MTLTINQLKRQTEVQHSTDKPPIWDELVERYHPSWERTAVAYGDTIHAKYLPLPPDVEVHERIHLKQQGYTKEGAKEWWDKYINDTEFRLEQELEAYQGQYKFLQRTLKDKNQLNKKVLHLAHTLSTLYGFKISKTEALEKIKQ